MGQKGIKKVFQTKLTDIALSDKEGVGTVRHEGDDEYIWLKGVVETIVGSVVIILSGYTTVILTTALGAAPARLAVALSLCVADRWGWYQIRGVGAVYCTASCAKDVQLYTDTALDTTGGVDDTSTSEHAIHGMLLNDTCGGAAAVTACRMVHPWTAPTFD